MEYFALSPWMEVFKSSKQPGVELLMQDVLRDIYFQGLHSTYHRTDQSHDGHLATGTQTCQPHLAQQPTYNTVFSQRQLPKSHTVWPGMVDRT